MDVDEDVDEFLEHFGVRGMHWGFRQGASKTGISRTRGSVLDRNQRNTQTQIRRAKGKGTIRDRVSQIVLKTAAGEKHAKEYRNFRMDYLKNQKKKN